VNDLRQFKNANKTLNLFLMIRVEPESLKRRNKMEQLIKGNHNQYMGKVRFSRFHYNVLTTTFSEKKVISFMRVGFVIDFLIKLSSGAETTFSLSLSLNGILSDLLREGFHTHEISCVRGTRTYT
jgi:hypothetical protein